MNEVYRALADPPRRKILEILRDGDLSAGELADQFPQSKPTLSKHFSILKEAELNEGRRDGTTIIYTLNVSLLEEAMWGLMEAFDLAGRSGAETKRENLAAEGSA